MRRRVERNFPCVAKLHVVNAESQLGLGVANILR
jgi:hypothetical protein